MESSRMAVGQRRVLPGFGLSLGYTLCYLSLLVLIPLAACVNVVLGLLIAWVRVRSQFPGKRVFDSLIDLPFALPTAVAGLVYSSLYVENGWLGRYLVPLGIEGAYSRSAIVLVLTFLGLPFVARAIQPVLETIDADTEEASFLLGATRLQTFLRVILPTVLPAAVTGFA